MKKRIGLLNILTLKEGQPEPRAAILMRRFPGLEVAYRCIPDQYEGVHDSQSEQKAVPKIVDLGQSMAEEGFDALIVNCASDPGVAKLRQIADVPIIGAGSAAAGLALATGSRIATLGIRDNAPAIMQQVLGAHLLAQVRPEGVLTAADLRTDSGREASLKTIERLGSHNPDVICLACTGYAVFGLAEWIEKETRIPVVDALEAAGLAAWYRTVQ